MQRIQKRVLLVLKVRRKKTGEKVPLHQIRQNDLRTSKGTKGMGMRYAHPDVDGLNIERNEKNERGGMRSAQKSEKIF